MLSILYPSVPLATSPFVFEGRLPLYRTPCDYSVFAIAPRNNKSGKQKSHFCDFCSPPILRSCMWRVAGSHGVFPSGFTTPWLPCPNTGRTYHVLQRTTTLAYREPSVIQLISLLNSPYLTSRDMPDTDWTCSTSSSCRTTP